MLILSSGGTGTAEPCEPRQVREEAAVRRIPWAPPANLSGRTFHTLENDADTPSMQL